MNWDYQVGTEHLCFAHWDIIIFTLCAETRWKQNAIKWGQKQTSYVRLWFGTCVPMYLAFFLPVNKRRKACGSWVLHGKLVYSFGHWKNEVMCWNWSHTWKTSGGKAEAREHWEYAQCLLPRTGFCHERTTILANCMLYLWMRGQWWILLFFKYRDIFDMLSMLSSQSNWRHFVWIGRLWREKQKEYLGSDKM